MCARRTESASGTRVRRRRDGHHCRDGDQGVDLSTAGILRDLRGGYPSGPGSSRTIPAGASISTIGQENCIDTRERGLTKCSIEMDALWRAATQGPISPQGSITTLGGRLNTASSWHGQLNSQNERSAFMGPPQNDRRLAASTNEVLSGHDLPIIAGQPTSSVKLNSICSGARQRLSSHAWNLTRATTGPRPGAASRAAVMGTRITTFPM